MRRVLFAIFLIAAPFAAGSDWKVLTYEDAKTGVAVDLHSVIRYGDGYRKAWLIWSYDTQKPGGGQVKPYFSSKTLDHFNCPQRTSMTAREIFYEEKWGKGEVAGIFDMPPITNAFKDVIPDSMGEGVLNYVCSVQIGLPKPKTSVESRSASNSSGKPRHSAEDLKKLAK